MEIVTVIYPLHQSYNTSSEKTTYFGLPIRKTNESQMSNIKHTSNTHLEVNPLDIQVTSNYLFVY